MTSETFDEWYDTLPSADDVVNIAEFDPMTSEERYAESASDNATAQRVDDWDHRMGFTSHPELDDRPVFDQQYTVDLMNKAIDDMIRKLEEQVYAASPQFYAAERYRLHAMGFVDLPEPTDPFRFADPFQLERVDPSYEVSPSGLWVPHGTKSVDKWVAKIISQYTLTPSQVRANAGFPST